MFNLPAAFFQKVFPGEWGGENGGTRPLQDDAEPELALPDALGTDTKEYQGWRCSYRLECPEHTTLHSIRPKLQRKLAGLSAALDGEEAQRRRCIEERASAAQASQDCKNNLQKRYRNALAAARQR